MKLNNSRDNIANTIKEKQKFPPIKINFTNKLTGSKISSDIKYINKRNSYHKKNYDQLSDLDKYCIKNVLKHHFLFKDKSVEILNKIIDKIEIQYYEGGTEVESVDLFYIIKEGEVELISEGSSLKKRYKSEETFGEIILIEKIEHLIIFKCIENTTFYILKGEVFREIVQKLNDSESKERFLFISFVPIFKNLNAIQLSNVATSMYKCEFATNQYIITEGDYGKSLYIIKDGNVECLSNNTVVRELKSKDYFGEFALLFNEKRTLSVKATRKTICFQISQGILISCLGENYRTIILRGIAKSALKKSKYLKLFESEYFFNKFFKNEEILTLENNVVLIKGDKDNNNNGKLIDKNIYIMISGDLIQKEENKEDKTVCMRGELFGDINLKENKMYDNDIITKGNSRILKFNWDKICNELNIGIDKKKYINFFIQLYHIKNIQIFKNSSDLKLIDICKVMNKEKFNEKEIIFKEGDNGDKLYLIKKGKIDCFKNNKFIRQLSEGNCFGETSLLKNVKRSATIIANTKVSVYSLTRENFNLYIDKNILNYIYKKISLQDNFENSLEDLYFCFRLGKGKFGNVSLVHNKENFYAMKRVKRKEAERQVILIKYFITERTILLKLDHPFIMKLVKTFKTEEDIFYMMEFINGKVLGTYLESRKNNNNNLNNIFETQFFLSFLFIIVDYLNSKNICHRDLKPDNIMLDEKGYIKVIDFGTAIEINNFTSTITGTPHYIAPEVLIGKSYGFSCDYWSIGIIGYEIFYGNYPFGNKATDPMEVYKEIIKKELKLPKNNFAAVNDFISLLLKKKITERMCCFEKIKNHDFYKDFNWDDLMNFKLNPPYIPKTKLLNQCKTYTMKYIDYLKIEKKKEKNYNLNKKIEEEENINKNKKEKYKFDPSWADIF